MYTILDMHSRKKFAQVILIFTAQRSASTVYAMVLCLFVHLSVCLSVTSWSSTETDKCSIMQTMLYNNPGTLVF